MKINPQIFRGYDIRGIWKKDLTKEVFQKIGFALSKKGKKFLVGYDIRKSSPYLAKALISGLVTRGGEVFFAKRGNFGLILFSGLRAKVDFTLFVTASHLPAEWNGLKLYRGDGMPVSPAKIKREVLKLEEKKICFKKPKAKIVNFKRDYINFLFQKFSFLKSSRLKVILDCGGGATTLVAPQLFKKFFKIKEIFSKTDPYFRGRPSEPKEEALGKLKSAVLKEKAHFGVAFDGDGDRGVIIDDKGRYLRGDIVGIILAKDFLKTSKNKKIVKTISCSMKVEEILKKFGAQIIESPVGHTFVAQYCKKYKAILGMEESSHILMPRILPFDDALLIPLKLGEILLKTKKKLSQIVNEIGIYPFGEFVFKVPDEIKFKIVDDLGKELKRKYKISTLDGVKIYFDDGWILIRGSQTSPKIRLYVEAKTKKRFKELKEKFSQILKEKLCSV